MIKITNFAEMKFQNSSQAYTAWLVRPTDYGVFEDANRDRWLEWNGGLKHKSLLLWENIFIFKRLKEANVS